MRISGLQKLSLLDFPERLSCIVFTQGCNMACPFCHNSDLIPAQEGELSTDEVLAFLDKRKGVLEGVCISGGEPLLQGGLIPFLQAARGMGYLVKLDTNGLFPQKLKELIDLSLLDYIAMDIKNSKEKYPATCGLTGGENAYKTTKESAHIIMNSGVDYEFRTTLVKGIHEKSDMDKIGAEFPLAKRYFLQTFVDSGRVLKDGLEAFSSDEMQQMLEVLGKHIKNASIR